MQWLIGCGSNSTLARASSCLSYATGCHYQGRSVDLTLSESFPLLLLLLFFLFSGSQISPHQRKKGCQGYQLTPCWRQKPRNCQRNWTKRRRRNWRLRGQPPSTSFKNEKEFPFGGKDCLAHGFLLEFFDISLTHARKKQLDERLVKISIGHSFFLFLVSPHPDFGWIRCG